MRPRPHCRQCSPWVSTRGISGLDIITALIRRVKAQGLLRGNTSDILSSRNSRRDRQRVGSAYLLGLNVERIRHAIGISAPRATSLIGNIGTMTKCAHCGVAAAAGLDAALLVARGFTANPDPSKAAWLRRSILQSGLRHCGADASRRAVAYCQPRLRDENVPESVGHALRDSRRPGKHGEES
jgi:MmgE/PrpD N-terminal domain